MSEPHRTQPVLSVVIGSRNARTSIYECLSSVESQRNGREIEIVVVDNSTDGMAEIVDSQFPQLRLIKSPRTALMPELWETGIRESTGKIVAITTSDFVPRQDWIEQILQAHDSTYVGIGGAIDNDPDGGLTDWAVYFCRYSSFMPPFDACVVSDVAGDNASYKRWAIDQCQNARRNGFWEAMVHDEFRKAGMKLLLNPSIVVSHRKSFTLIGFVKQRCLHGRQFGSARAARVSGLKRMIYLMLSPSLPLLLLLRIARRVASKRRYIGKFLLSLPILMLFLLSWSVGETSGYLWIAQSEK